MARKRKVASRIAAAATTQTPAQTGVLRLGSSGPPVAALQAALAKAGFPPGAIDGEFGAGTQAALLAFQKSEGLGADGIAGPKTAAALGLQDSPPLPTVIAQATVPVVSQMFPVTPLANIKANLPPVLAALVARALTDKPMVLTALATIRAETESFLPLSEEQSRFNTSPNGLPFDLYDYRKDLGNTGPPDGANFRGRGFVQLTGRANYARYGALVGQDLVDNPALANDPAVAAALLAAFLLEHEARLRTALAANDLAAARRIVNGGNNGVDRFVDAYTRGAALLAG